MSIPLSLATVFSAHQIYLLDQGLLVLLVTLAMLYLVVGLDDLFIDIAALATGAAPELLSTEALLGLQQTPESLTAIMVPAWRESSIIQRMLRGNLDRIRYKKIVFFVGVYPNDPATILEVTKMSLAGFPVVAVVNSRPGPTSKGQMLNEVVLAAITYEQKNHCRFEIFLMQDAEDVIHPETLRLVNSRLLTYDFVQVPVFSLSVGRDKLVASTYMDEFAESHTKDLLVRDALGAAIPSAGVGTAISRRVIDAFLTSRGTIFNEKSLTEDYELGNQAYNQGFRTHFASCYYRLPSGEKEFIATREFFPKTFRRSLRQKTRWTIGIAFQGRRHLPWQGNAINRYFLYRDRKGPVTNIIGFLGYPMLFLCLVHPASLEALTGATAGKALLGVNIFLMLNRFGQRMWCVGRVYGASTCWPVILAWPVANTINAFASVLAIRDDVRSRITRTDVKWAKTDHELPEFFGITPLEAS